MIAPDGHTYEKEEIVKWLKKNGTSPMTGMPIKRKFIINNHLVRKAIDRYKEKLVHKALDSARRT